MNYIHPTGLATSKESLAFFGRRMAILMGILAISSFFPNINTVLSLFGGSICGVIVLILPIAFYKAAYINRPSKKDRRCLVYTGYLIAVICVVLGVLGVK